VLGNVRAVAPDGDIVEVPRASQRRLLGLLALHSPKRLRTDRCRDDPRIAAKSRLDAFSMKPLEHDEHCRGPLLDPASGLAGLIGYRTYA